MRIQMHAPAGTARVVVSGVTFGKASCYSTDIPRCTIVKFTDTELVVQNTSDDGDGAPGQFGIDIDLVGPFDAGTISGQTTDQATLAVQSPFDGSFKTLGTNQPETVQIQWISFALV